MCQISTKPYTQDAGALKLYPLAPRDPNACPRFPLQMASARKAVNGNNVYSYKTAGNPLLQRKSSERQDQDRRAYLKRVRQTSDDLKWESRCEQVKHLLNHTSTIPTSIQILRQDFLSRKKQWEIDQAQAAPETRSAPDDEELISSTQGRLYDPDPGFLRLTRSTSIDIEVIDHLLSQESQELEDLVALIERSEEHAQAHRPQCSSSDYGSDEEEYDQLLIDEITKADRHAAEAGIPATQQDHQMDTSLG